MPARTFHFYYRRYARIIIFSQFLRQMVFICIKFPIQFSNHPENIIRLNEKYLSIYRFDLTIKINNF